jgi:hypothetical protein
MSVFDMTASDLCACLSRVPPLQLTGLTWLQAGQAVNVVSLPRPVVTQAVLELMAYTEGCRRAGGRLQAVSAIPLAHPLVEWVL